MLIDRGQLPDAVEDDDIAARLGVDRQLAPQDGLEPFLAAQLMHLGNALGVARRQDEKRIRRRAAHAAECAQHRPFFALHRAAGDDDRARG